jgi:Fe-S oxidoreductase
MALTREVADVFYRCTGCNRQKTYCQHKTELAEPMFAARAMARERGVEPVRLEGFDARFASRRRELTRRLRKSLAREHLSVRRDGRPAGEEAVDVLVYPGCVQLSRNPEGVLETLELVRRLGLGRTAVFAGDDPCTGFPFITTGRPDALARHAERQARALSDARLIVATCPGCVHTLKVVYPSKGVRIDAEILHLSELLDRYADRLPLRSLAQPIAYHDPCYLGRHLGVYDEPRRLLASVGEVVELAHSRADALCSGGGGAVPLLAPETSRAIAQSCLGIGLDGLLAASGRARQLVATGCPQAARMLSSAAGESGAPDVEVVELGALLYRALER